MKALNLGKKVKQSGFTIIELIVVILLLGILTATALPRFIDVTAEAHGAVVDATSGGIGTAMALFHAQWIAEGQPSVLASGEFDTGDSANTSGANSAGYPTGDDDDTAPTAEADCLNIFTGLLQTGGQATTVVAGGGVASSFGSGDAGGGVGDGFDFTVVFADDTSTTRCEYYYTGQFFTNGDTVPYITLVPATGLVTLSTSDATLGAP